MNKNIIVASRHLRSMTEICKTFGKGRRTVKTWYIEGAPIGFDGFSYFTEYNSLQNWLVDRTKVKKG